MTNWIDPRRAARTCLLGPRFFRPSQQKAVDLQKQVHAALLFPAPSGLPSSSADLSPRAVSNHLGRSDQCFYPLLPHRCQASPLSGGLATFATRCDLWGAGLGSFERHELQGSERRRSGINATIYAALYRQPFRGSQWAPGGRRFTRGAMP